VILVVHVRVDGGETIRADDLHATTDAAGGLRPDVTISGRQAQLAGQVLRVAMRSGSGTLVETWNQEVTDTTAEIPGVTDSAR